MINISDSTTAELVAFYNENADKPVKKFRDRVTAEKRVQELVDSLQEATVVYKPVLEEEEHQPLMTKREKEEDAALTEKYGFCRCPSCKAHLSNGVDVKGNAFICMGCSHEWERHIPSAKLSESVSRSWTNPKTRAARIQRHAVMVSQEVISSSGITFRSVKQAFEHLELPLKKHKKFRAALKALGETDAFGYHWKMLD